MCAAVFSGGEAAPTAGEKSPSVSEPPARGQGQTRILVKVEPETFEEILWQLRCVRKIRRLQSGDEDLEKLVDLLLDFTEDVLLEDWYDYLEEVGEE